MEMKKYPNSFKIGGQKIEVRNVERCDDNSSLYGVTGEGENLVDASIEIIERLKKRNLL